MLSLPYYPELPDLMLCKHYPKEKVYRDSPELHECFDNHHISCIVFAHIWKVTEDKFRLDSDEETDSIEHFRLIGITRQCKMCGSFSWEYFPHDRFHKNTIRNFEDDDMTELH